ncbi:DoxX family protein [Micromonospora sp. KC721]|uniref:DoxX family protein n=1 Tax=Micromonospora sp. KC721 TaxID=2530380 RepID=UPI0010433E37|nr:DoxX family protein [Micromonospora sp. KC721]TDB82250.1 DoxX family protein [Micromonospora sp. KC721]
MNAQRITGPFLSVFRIVIGLLFSFHGLGAIFGIMGRTEPVPFGEWPGWWAGLIEMVCGALVLLGAATRPAAILASGAMAYAYFVVHQPQALFPTQNGGVEAALYAWAFLAVAVLGAGPWSIDALWHRRSAEVVPA